MKITELRICNWYEMNGQPFWLEMRWMYQWASGKLPIENIKPIPLTTKWLEIFGFEYEFDSWDKYYGNKHHMRVQFWEHTKEFHHVCNSGDTDTTLKYVHQLQNLYFALTGEELEIKK